MILWIDFWFFWFFFFRLNGADRCRPDDPSGPGPGREPGRGPGPGDVDVDGTETVKKVIFVAGTLVWIFRFAVGFFRFVQDSFEGGRPAELSFL